MILLLTKKQHRYMIKCIKTEIFEDICIDLERVIDDEEYDDTHPLDILAAFKNLLLKRLYIP